MRHSLLVITALWLLLFGPLALAQDIATSLYPYLYTNLNNWPCVRLLNATGVIGCHSPHTQGGVLYQVKSQDDIDRFVTDGEPSGDTFAIVLGYHLLSKSNIQALSSTGRVNGLIVLLRGALSDDQIAMAKSPEGPCPNCQFGLYANDADQYSWNPNGEDIIEQSFGMPIFALDPMDNLSNQVYNLVMESIEYNELRGFSNYPLRAMDFKLFMWAAVSSETCLRRGKCLTAPWDGKTRPTQPIGFEGWCEPVGGMSVYSSHSKDIAADDGKPIVMVAAALDSRSLFHDLTVGVGNDVSGLVAVLAVADALSRVPTSNLSKHIVYGLFTAESWGFAGSQRFVQDISTPFQCTNGSRATPCPYQHAPCTNPCVKSLKFTQINFDQIQTIIELNSVANVNGTGYWAHVDDITQSGSLVDSMVGGSSVIRAAYEDGFQRKLPPSSVMSFLEKNRNIKAVVVTDYQSQMGSLYDSDLDDSFNETSQSICSLVNTTARVVYSEAQGSTTTTNTSDAINQISANCTLIETLMDCLVSNFSCSFMQNYFNVSGISRISHYPSVFDFRNPQPQLLPRFAFSFLAGVTGTPRYDSNNAPVSCRTIQDCEQGEYCIKQQCLTTFTEYHDAYGTGLQYDEGTGELKVVDASKGTWTESTWDPPLFRIFLTTSKRHQIVELVIGILWTLCSIVAVVLLQRYLKKALKTE